jgi:uncharacterized protein Yka (UPF0111/DUF47 family)
MRHQHWFLPETPDVVGLLRKQVAVTLDGVDAFARWTGGDASASEAVRDTEARGNTAKRELLGAVREAFVTPLEPEDLFTLSRSIDWVLAYVRDLVNEAEVMACTPDAGMAEMATHLQEAIRHLDEAISHIGSDADAATAAADACLAAERRLDHTYYRGMAALLEIDDMRTRIARRELYRRCSRIGDVMVDAAERVVYAVVKQS